MKKKFIKMHGLGNDCVIFDDREGGLSLTIDQIRMIGDRQTGIGFDQMIVIDPPKTQQYDAFIRIYNADGSEVQACGNATRCVGSYLAKSLDKQMLQMQSIAGDLTAEMIGDLVRVNMGIPKLKWQEIPLSHEIKKINFENMDPALKNGMGVSMGNPHAVFFVDDVMAVDVLTLGPDMECHPLFPEKANIEFAQIISPTHIRMRVWERGAGMTRACGSGACATVVAAIEQGLTEKRTVTVEMDGGQLEITWDTDTNHVLMTGPVATVFEGVIEI